MLEDMDNKAYKLFGICPGHDYRATFLWVRAHRADDLVETREAREGEHGLSSGGHTGEDVGRPAPQGALGVADRPGPWYTSDFDPLSFGAVNPCCA